MGQLGRVGSQQSFNPASLFLANFTLAILGSASFQRSRNTRNALWLCPFNISSSIPDLLYLKILPLVLNPFHELFEIGSLCYGRRGGWGWSDYCRHCDLRPAAFKWSASADRREMVRCQREDRRSLGIRSRRRHDSAQVSIVMI